MKPLKKVYRIDEDTPKCVLQTVETMLRSLYLPVRNNNWARLTFYFVITNMIIMEIAHVTYMVIHITDMTKMADACSTVSTTFQGLFKLTSLYFNSSNITKMCAIIYHDFWPTYVVDSHLRISLNKLARRIEILMMSFYVLIFFCCSLLLIPPLFLGIRELPLASYYPFNWQLSPLYESMYVWQWIVNLYGVCFVVGSHDFLFVTMMVNLIIQFRILQDVLVKIGTKQERKMNEILLECSGVEDSKYCIKEEDKLLVKCVAHHMKLLDFADIVEKTFSHAVFLQFAESVLGLCLGVFLLDLVDGVNFIKLVFFIIGHLMQLFLYCIFGNEIMYQSVRVADAAFDCDWHLTYCPSLRKGLTLMIQRAQRSKKITALGMADLNILSFIEVIRSSISFSTLFKTMIEKQNEETAITMRDAGKYPLVFAKIMLSILCLWPLNRSVTVKVLRYIMLGNMLFMGSAHLIYMLRNITDIAVMASTCTTVSTSIQTISKIFLLNYYSDDLAHLLNIVSNEYWPADLAGPETERSILIGSRVIITMECFYFSTAFTSCWDFMAIPLVYGRRILPLQSSFPFEWNSSPLYEIMYVWQFFSNSYIVVYTIASFDFLLNCLMKNSIAQFKLLKAALRTIGTGKNKIINRKLRNYPGMPNRNYHLGPNEEEEYELVAKCVEHHNKIIYVCDNLERIYGKMVFLQFFLSATAICVSTFVLTKFDNYLTKMLSFSMAHLIQFFFLCATGNDLIHQSISVADAAYDSEWYNKPYLQVRRGLVLLQQRAQREQKITAMGFANLDFPNFINVLRLSFSFYTMLSTLEEEN